jgi:hypothetical protein
VHITTLEADFAAVRATEARLQGQAMVNEHLNNIYHHSSFFPYDVASTCRADLWGVGGLISL